MRLGPLGIWELLIILVLVLLVFGSRRLPETAKGIVQSVREFRKGIRNNGDDPISDDPISDDPISDAKTARDNEASESDAPFKVEV